MPGIARLQEVFDALTHTTEIFPDDTNLTLTFTAHANAHTWLAWTEIADSGANTMTSLFTSNPGHVTALYIEELSDIDAIYMLEISYGAAKVLVTSGRFAGATKFQVPPGNLKFATVEIPSGKTVYYRMKSGTAVADTALVHFRYHTH